MMYSLLFSRMSVRSSLTKKVIFFCPGGLDFKIRDLTDEEWEFIASLLDRKDPDGKLPVYQVQFPSDLRFYLQILFNSAFTIRDRGDEVIMAQFVFLCLSRAVNLKHCIRNGSSNKY